MEVKDLVEALKAVEESNEVKEQTYLTNGVLEELPEVIAKAVLTAEDVLISSGGRVNYKNKKELENNGYKVFPGEKDSFGWLTGCIATKKGIVVFG